jgi:hypothetical protein
MNKYGKLIKSVVTPTVVLTAYSAEDVIGGLLTFDVSELTTNGGLINSAILIVEDSQAEPFKLYLFDSLPSTIADDAAFAPTVADLQKLCSVISFLTADYVTVNTFDYCIVTDINNVFSTTTGKLYGYLVANASTPDYANADTLTITLRILGE